MSFHYSREWGPEGQIVTEDGPGRGTPLALLLERGPLPVRAALELVASLADILSVSQEDREVHGDVQPRFVKIDEGAAVVLEGFGQSRRSGRAPEGLPATVATDVYGLGIVLHSTLSPEPLGNVPRDRDSHDDHIVDHLSRIDWRELRGRKWLDDVVHFLCTMLAWEPSERPTALDVANMLSQIAQQAPGEDLNVWAERYTRPAHKGAPTPLAPPEDPDESLDGPQSLSGPMSATSALKIRKAASAKGESTAFWSRDKIKAMLAEEEDEPVRARFDPMAGRPQSKPSRPPETELPPFPDTTYSGAVGAPAPRPVNLVPPPLVPRQGPPPPPPAPSRPPPPAPASPQITAGRPPDSLPELPPEPAPSNGGAIKVVIAFAALGLLLCGGGGLMAGGWYFWNSQEDVEVAPVKALPEEAEAPRGEAVEEKGAPPVEGEATAAGDEAAEPEAPAAKAAASPPPPEEAPKKESPKKEASPEPRKESPRDSSTSRSGTATSPTPKETPPKTSRPPKADSSPAPKGGFDVKFTMMGQRAELVCGDGQRSEFVGALRLHFDSVTTCMVKTASSRAAVTVSAPGSVSCTDSSGSVVCSGG